MDHRNLAILILSSALLLALNCDAQTPQKTTAAPGPHAGPRQSQEAERVRAAWEEKVRRLQKAAEESKTHGKGIVREKFEFLEELLKEAPAETAPAELKRLQASPLSYGEMSDYEQTFIQLFVDNYIKQNARVELVGLLAAKSPRYVGYAPLEVALTQRRGADNLLLLFEAFERSGDEASKKTLLRVLGDVFRDARRQHAGDQEFLAASRQWYQANRDRLEINPRYHPSSTWPGGGDFFLKK